jgi:ABC-type phosphate transport system substrate-binding protein
MKWVRIGGDRSLQRLLESEVDFAAVMASVMAQDNLSSSLANNKIMLLPLFLRRVVPLYSLSTLSASVDNLILSFDVLSQIWRGIHVLITFHFIAQLLVMYLFHVGDITSWNDPRIAAINPTLAATNKLPYVRLPSIRPHRSVVN